MKPSKQLSASSFKRKFGKLRTVIVSVFVLVLILVLVRVFTVVFDTYFLIKGIELNGSGRYINKEDVLQVVTEQTKNKNLVLIKPNDVKALIASNFLAVKDTEIIKEYPSKLVINLKERQSIVILETREPKEFFLTDIEGFVLGTVDPSELNFPVIKMQSSNTVKVGNFIEKSKVFLYVRLLEEIKAQNISIERVESDTGFIRFFTSEGIEVFISLEKDIKTSSKLLSEVLLKFKLDNILLKKVDLRYDNVVVEY